MSKQLAKHQTGPRTDLLEVLLEDGAAVLVLGLPLVLLAEVANELIERVVRRRGELVVRASGLHGEGHV